MLMGMHNNMYLVFIFVVHTLLKGGTQKGNYI